MESLFFVVVMFSWEVFFDTQENILHTLFCIACGYNHR